MKEIFAFFRNVVVFFTTLSAIVFIALLILTREGFDPILSNSLSFDHKMINLKKRNLGTINVIAVGSSITLNNLNSHAMCSILRGESYYNMSSWGLKMADLERDIPVYIERYSPQIVLICSSPVDFVTGSEKVRITANEMKFILGKSWIGFYYLKNFQLIELLKRQRKLKEYILAVNDYTNLTFDSWGGVGLEVKKENRDESRRRRTFIYNRTEFMFQYHCLYRIGEICKKNNVRLVFIQSPVSYDYLRTEKIQERFRQHLMTCKLILKQTDNTFLDMSNSIGQEETYFSDPIHLSREGAEAFTCQLGSRLNKILLINSIRNKRP